MNFFSELFEGVPVQFNSNLAPELALERVGRLIRWERVSPYPLATVTGDRVFLRLLVRSRGDAGTCFEGSVAARADGSVLSGRFVAKKSMRVINAIGAGCAGIAFIGVLLANLMQMVVQYQDSHGLLLRAGSLLETLAGILVFAWFLALNGSPKNREMRELSQSIRSALRDDD